MPKPLLIKTIELAKELDHNSLTPHTQTTTRLAAKLYLVFGFEILSGDETKGQNILKTMPNHPMLKFEYFV